jgi:hypothetical protein
VGALKPISGFLHGQLQELRISRKARYNSSYSVSDSLTADADTVALYDFSRDTGTELKDLSENGHHGKIVGAKWVSASQPPDEPINILGMLDLRKDALDDGFRLENGVLFTPPWKNRNSRIVFPLDSVPLEYDIHLVVERKTQQGFSLSIGVLMGDHQACVDMDGGRNKAWCLSKIDGKSMHDGNVTTVEGQRLPLDKKVVVDISVRRDGVKVVCEGESVIDWNGRPDQLSLWEKIIVPKDKLFLFSQNEYEVQSLTLTPVTVD